MEIKKNIPLLIGILIPVLMIIFVAASIYLPSLFIKPSYDFVYAIGDNQPYPYGSYGTHYKVENGKIVREIIPPPPDYERNTGIKPLPQVEPKLYYYDIQKNESRVISYEEAQKYKLNPSRKSPDGFEIVPRSHGTDFPFFFDGRDYNTWYITSRSTSRKLNIEMGQPYAYYGNFDFLGWVEK